MVRERVRERGVVRRMRAGGGGRGSRMVFLFCFFGERERGRWGSWGRDLERELVLLVRSHGSRRLDLVDEVEVDVLVEYILII